MDDNTSCLAHEDGLQTKVASLKRSSNHTLYLNYDQMLSSLDARGSRSKVGTSASVSGLVQVTCQCSGIELARRLKSGLDIEQRGDDAIAGIHSFSLTL